jgi:type II secretory pathway component PulF
MPNYQYTAVSSLGEEDKGVMEAFSEQDVAVNLRQRALAVVSVDEVVESSEGMFSWLLITAADRIMLLRQLAMMTRAGITISSALTEISATVYKTKIKNALDGVRADLQSGESLTVSMGKHSKVFPPLVCGVVEAAEQTGELAPAFERLGDMLGFRSEIRKKLISSFIYPGIVLVFSVLVTYALFFKFIPKLAKFLQNLGKPLPPFTQKVFNVAASLQENALLILICATLLGVGFLISYRIPRSRRVLESILLRIPIFGKIMTYAEISMFSSTLRAMMDSGNSLISSLPLLGKSMITLRYQDWILECKDKLMQGKSLQQCMDKKLIPGSARSVIKTGEMSGSLPEAFGELEGYYSNILQHKINLLVALINPALIICVGSIVAVVYIAIILAIVSVNGA